MPSPASFEQRLLCEPTLLTYKYLMSKLSMIVQQVLAQLYRIGSTEASDSVPSANTLVGRVGDLNQDLMDWKEEIPDPLNVSWTAPPDNCYASPEQLDRDVGASGSRFESHIFQLQALSIHLAYENARILIHRPLLSIRFRTQPNLNSNIHLSSGNEGPLVQALHICRDAALTTSRLISAPVMSLAAETYAAAFIGIHTFTAALTLCILFSTDPLGSQSHEIKLGLQRLMAVQQKLRVHSPLSAQGLEILKQLVRHVMEKEWGALLEGPQVGSQNNNVNLAQPTTAYAMGPLPLRGNDYPHEMQALPPGETFPILVTGGATVEQDIPSHRQEYIPDPTLLQAIADVDRGKCYFVSCPRYSRGRILIWILAINSSYSADLPEQDSPNGLGWSLSEQQLFPEQAWIWSLDALDYSQCL
jgi:hypothetical protein